jgi:hypothetical protein
MQTELPYWLQSLIILGREDDEDKDDEGQDNEEEDEEEEEEEDDDKGKKNDADDDGDDLKARADALEASLKKERKLRRQAERDARKASKARADSKEEKDAAALRKELEDQGKKTQRLAEGFLNSARDKAILDAAREAGFIDPTDALIDSVRTAVDTDQDEEDPTDIDIDEDSVREAVQKLAKKKKHLIGKPGDGERSGGKFRKKSGDQGADEQALVEHYPSLR